ncbi:PfkB family carbohydrate kinase [Mycolicibacterium hippocampi]|uniref:Ribokinase n=1 Tax=Mycolicibacterium hippocampi TaxID=659824 RepID=A0A850PR98_9MYCO|nr:Ribokinase [Mycolicibacterium hippocampi]
MGDRGRVISLASILVDLAVEVPRLPDRGGDVLAAGTHTDAAAGFNVVAAAARHGASCIYAGPHGTGPHGDRVRAALRAEGIPAAFPTRRDGDTGFCIVLVEPDGERTFITTPGAESIVHIADLDDLDVRTEDLIALSGYDLVYAGSGPVIAEWLTHLERGTVGPRVLLDPGPLIADIPAEVWSRVLPRLDVLTLNQREARILADADDAHHTDLLAAVLSQPGMSGDLAVVLREGPHGCLATGGPLADSVVHIPAPQVGTVVDTTGAGDTHTGVLLACLARAETLTAALTAATEAASSSVTTSGPATAPTSDTTRESSPCP